MEPLTTIGIEAWITSLLAMAMTLFTACGLGMVIWRVVEEQLQKAQTKELRAQEASIFAWLEGPSSAPVPPLALTPVLRDFLVRLAGQVEGDLRVSLLELYAKLGFAAADLKALQRRSFQVRVEALQRARSMNFPLPNDAWPLLLKRGGPGWYWAVLDLLVQRKGRHALPWLFAGTLAPGGRQRGIWVHLFIAVSRRAPEVIPFMLTHVGDEFYQTICLRVLAAYPAPVAAEAIARMITPKTSTLVVQACLEAIAVHPSEPGLRRLDLLTSHDNEDVRCLVAKVLSTWQADEGAGILEMLSVDLAYRVREAAIEALASCGSRCTKVLQAIESEAEHPSHALAMRKRLTSIEQVSTQRKSA